MILQVCLFLLFVYKQTGISQNSTAELFDIGKGSTSRSVEQPCPETATLTNIASCAAQYENWSRGKCTQGQGKAGGQQSHSCTQREEKMKARVRINYISGETTAGQRWNQRSKSKQEFSRSYWPERALSNKAGRLQQVSSTQKICQEEHIQKATETLLRVRVTILSANGTDQLKLYN